ncbi:syntaxin-8 isoform X2 [Numida meleagris]|uniref:syntaxin-8 isoform X2 n=1 Tax=Numida meleagris TaxID=8996 RepID=UPI000B3DF9D1|nr:syntaxin-8 isoform X2 [Numida meleagris]
MSRVKLQSFGHLLFQTLNKLFSFCPMNCKWNQLLEENCCCFADDLVESCSPGLCVWSLTKSISTQLEGDRRQNLVDDLLTRQKQLQASYKNEGPEPDAVRSSLMAGGVKRGVSNPWLLEESEETRGLGFDDIRQQQRRIIEEQDAGLDALSSIISRQKQMGQEIGNELDEQNEIIDDLTNLVENTDGKLRTQTRHVKMVDKKSASCGMLVVIVLLLIAIAVVAVWPTK